VIGHLEKFLGGDMLDTDRAALLTDQLLNVIMPELEREPRTPTTSGVCSTRSPASSQG
jgi:hypothetical protein